MKTRKKKNDQVVWRRRPRALADLAMKKLFLDEPVSDEEVAALFESDYVRQEKPHIVGGANTLYRSSSFTTALTTSVLFSDGELEVLAYFGRHPEMLFSLPPRRFEELVAAIFRNNGFEVQLTPETRDGGMDIIAVGHTALGGETLHLVECKRYLPDNTVGIGVVQRMTGIVEQHRATQGIIVTTSDFSRDARTCAESSRYRLDLNAYSDLANWLLPFHTMT